MLRVALGLFSAFLGLLGLMMQVGPHGAGTSVCGWLAFWQACPAALPDWFDKWAWVLPASLLGAAAIQLLWTPGHAIIRALAKECRLMPLHEGAAMIYGELRGTNLGRFTEGETDTPDEILDNVGMQILHHVDVRVRRPPSPKWEVFPKSKLNKMGVCQGATGIRSWGEAQIYYSDLKVSKRDVRRVARDLKKNANFISEWSKYAPLVGAQKPSDRASPLTISVGTDYNYYELDGRNRSLWSLTKIFKIKIENTDPSKTIAGCKLSILAIDPTPGSRSPWVLKDDFSLPAGDHVLVPLVRYEERREPEKYRDVPVLSDTIEVQSLGAHRPLLGIESTQKLHVRCTAVDVPFIDATIKLDMAEGRLRIEKI